jgi:hypothetical protein
MAQSGSSVAQGGAVWLNGAAWLSRMQRGLVCCALACKARPEFESRIGTPMEVAPTEPTAVKIWRWASAKVSE